MARENRVRSLAEVPPCIASEVRRAVVYEHRDRFIDAVRESLLRHVPSEYNGQPRTRVFLQVAHRDWLRSLGGIPATAISGVYGQHMSMIGAIKLAQRIYEETGDDGPLEALRGPIGPRTYQSNDGTLYRIERIPPAEGEPETESESGKPQHLVAAYEFDDSGSGRMTFRFPVSICRQIREVCDETGETQKQVVLRALREIGIEVDPVDMMDGRTKRYQQMRYGDDPAPQPQAEETRTDDDLPI